MPTLTPAYGRDYRSSKDAKADYYSGKDFKFNKLNHRNDGAYCSCRDFIDEVITIRYNRLRNTTTATYKELDEARYSGHENDN